MCFWGERWQRGRTSCHKQGHAVQSEADGCRPLRQSPMPLALKDNREPWTTGRWIAALGDGASMVNARTPREPWISPYAERGSTLAGARRMNDAERW